MPELIDRAAKEYARCGNYDWWFTKLKKKPSELRQGDPAVVGRLRQLRDPASTGRAGTLEGLVGALDTVAERLPGAKLRPTRHGS